MKSSTPEKNRNRLRIKQKKAKSYKGNRMLITVNVLGSTGPLRFLVYEDEVVSTVINLTLKSYAREGRLPVLGSNLNDFLLYCPTSDTSDALSPFEAIGAHSSRNFLLCKKPQTENAKNAENEYSTSSARRGKSRLKSWLNKTLSHKVASH
ncbi:unnamed protein product [Amaranthus hypochondriacus]